VEITFECYYTDSHYNWVESSKCHSWFSTGSSIKAYESETYNAYVAFEITIPLYFVKSGQIEFKYKKDTQRTYYTNGEFSFFFDEHAIHVDYDQTQNGWQIYRYNVTELGMHTIYFLYSKWNVKDVSDTMAAEIEVRFHPTFSFLISTLK
jgi:hypothetical protein